MLERADIERGVGQMADDTPSLATVLSRWIRKERLRPQNIERASGISRNHLWLITQGRVARPTPETLRKLARAVATDPDTHEVDQHKRAEALADFSRAAGYPDLTSDAESGDLVRAIQGAVGNLQLTGFWYELITTYPELTPTHQAVVRAVLASILKPGGGDVTARLLLALGTAEPLSEQGLLTLIATLRQPNGT